MAKNRRQEIYAQIRAAGDQDQYVLEEMVRLGFWGRGSGLPSDPRDEIERRGELLKQLQVLSSESQRLTNRSRVLKELRQQRMRESRERRQATIARRIQEAEAKAARWKARKAKEILYLGESFSNELNKHQGAPERLAAMALPPLEKPWDLAQLLGVEVAELRFLSFAREVSSVSHYCRFAIPKKSGGERLISAPMPRLKAAQRKVLDEILAKVPVHMAAHGFRCERSILTNALPHLNQPLVINLDLADFFPTISYPRVKGLFKSLGYGPSVATVLGLLCTEAAVAEVKLDGRTWYVAQGERFLPQGSPCSPAISNLICRKLDRRIQGLAEHFGLRYTRYADDLSFSGDLPSHELHRLLRKVAAIVEEEGFKVHPDKTRILRRGRRQEVTGLVVNGAKASIERQRMRRFRALLFQLEKDGPEGKEWEGARHGGQPDLFSSIEGFASFVYMVDREKGAKLLGRVRALRARFAPRASSGAPPMPESSALTERSSAHPHEEGSSAPVEASPPQPAEESQPKPKKKRWWRTF